MLTDRLTSVNQGLLHVSRNIQGTGPGDMPRLPKSWVKNPLILIKTRGNDLTTQVTVPFL
jgi:hypothetical protein